MRKIVLSPSQTEFLDLVFENVKSNNGCLKREVPDQFKKRYPNLKIGYKTLKNIHEDLKLKITRTNHKISRNTNDNNENNRSRIDNLNMCAKNERERPFLYSNEFLLFLNDNNLNMFIRDENSINDVLDIYNFKIHIILGDGLCFCSSVRLYLKEFQNIDLSIDEIKILTRRYFISNPNLIPPYLISDVNYEYYIEQSIVSYFDLKNFNSDFVDYFITYSPQLFNLNICIIEEINNNVLFHLMKTDPDHDYSSNLVVLHKQHLHYNLIIPKMYQIKSIINTFDTFDRALSNNEFDSRGNLAN